MKRALLLCCCALLCHTLVVAQGVDVAAKTEAAVARIKARPTQLTNRNGTIVVSCATHERANFRWPISTFAERVLEALNKDYLPLGSNVSPLAIEIGIDTNAVTTLRRRVFRTSDGYSHLILQIPNPDTVDLTLLREGIAEGLLREKVREQVGSYQDYTWPKWWLTALLNATRNNADTLEAYDRLQVAIRANGAPTLESLFKRTGTPLPEADWFLARWMLTNTVYQSPEKRLQLLTEPWSAEKLLETLSEAEWQKWLKQQDSIIYVPGVITYTQFLGWQERLITPTSLAEAKDTFTELARFAIARPQAFQDLTTLYLNAYLAYRENNSAEYERLRQAADLEAARFEQHLRQVRFLQDIPRLAEPESAP